MKLESLVIANQHVVVNDLSNFAHTAHHARRIVLAGHYLKLLENLCQVLGSGLKLIFKFIFFMNMF